MAKRDDVDVGILGILRGGLQQPSRHEVLVRTMLGFSLGTLAIDAGMPDDHILQACRELAGAQVPYGRLARALYGDEPHQELAFAIIHKVVCERANRDADTFVAECQAILTQVRIAAGDPTVMRKLRDAQSAAVNAKPRTDG